MPDLMTDFARVVTDLNRMSFENSDPMRHSKRAARATALAVLHDAVQTATAAMHIIAAIEDGEKDARAAQQGAEHG